MPQSILLSTFSFVPTIGGVERSVDLLADLFAARGHRVLVVTHRRWALPYRRSGNGRRATLALHIPMPCPASRPRELLRRVLDPPNARVLARAGARFGADVVHAHHLNADAAYARGLARRLGVPFVVTLRGGELENWMVQNDLRRRYVVDVLRSADHVTAVSRALLDPAVALVPEIAGRASVIPNPVDPADLARRRAAAPPLPEDEPFAAFVGRLDPMKDVATLVDAWHAWGAEAPPLLLVGEGPEGPALAARARSGPAAGRIRFLGARSHAEALAITAAARLLLLPSVHSEGCPNAVLEAMALGTPVVVSDLPALTELVEDGADGRVAPRGDARALAAAVRALWSDADARARLADAARRRIETRHRPDDVLDAYLGLYATLGTGCGSSS